MSKTLCLLVGFFLHLQLVDAQDMKDAFKKFRAEQYKGFQDTQRKQDSIFAEAIKQNWRTFQLNDPEEYLPEYDKPKTQPESEEKGISKTYEAEPSIQKLRTFEPELLEYEGFYEEADRTLAFDFFGQPCEFSYPSSLQLHLSYEPSKSYVANFWNATNQLPYQKVVNDFVQLKKELNLPGFGLYILIRDFSQQLSIASELQVLYQWFFLTKAGYNVRVGFSGKEPFLILGSATKLYGKPYFTEGDLTFYILDEQVKEISSYGNITSGAKGKIDFLFENPPDLPLRPRNKNYQFVHGEKAYDWEVFYNENVVNLMEEFPLVDLPIYLQSKGSFLLEKSLQKQLAKELEEATQVEAVSLLLSFVQKAFEYQSDQEQFGREKIMYPDQFVHYEKSDCDDRVVFLNYLITLFLDLETIAVIFPQHVALGTHFAMETYGETIDVEGDRFTFCDPTFYNAPIGSVIPQADRTQIEVVSF